MSINKISPALKRYKPGEMSRSIILNMAKANEEEISLKLNEEKISLSSSDKFSNASFSGKKNDIPKFEIEANLYKPTNVANSIETRTPYKQYTLDENCLDNCLEKLKWAMKKLNFNNVPVPNEIKEQILPETIFRKDLILLCSHSLDGAKETNNESANNSNKRYCQAKGKADVKKKKAEEGNPSGGVIFLQSKNIKEKADIRVGLAEENKDNSYNKDFSLNDSSQGDTGIPLNLNKFPLSPPLLENNYSIGQSSWDNLITPSGDLPQEQDIKENQIEFPLLSKKRKHPLESSLENNKDKERDRKNIFKTHRTEVVHCTKQSPKTNSLSNSEIDKKDKKDIIDKKDKITANLNPANPNAKKNQYTPRSISYFDKFFIEFKKKYNLHKVDARISETKEDFLFNYWRSDGIEAKYHIMYDQKKQKVLSMEKYFNNNLINKILNDENDAEVIEKIQSELGEMLKDISVNVMKKNMA